MKPTLHELAVKYGSDKLYAHSYIEHYSRLLSEIKVRQLCEIGIGFKSLMTPFSTTWEDASSLKMWKDYLPDAEIIGCDIREDVLINEPRIRCYQVDQSNFRSLNRLRMVSLESARLSVVIDDGSHDPYQQILTASVLLPMVEVGGIYICEDMYEDTAARFARMFDGEVIVGTKRPDDCLCVIRR